MKTLIFEPLIPIALWASLIAVAALLLVSYGRNAARRMKRGRLLAVLSLMTAAVALPLLILLNPQWMERLPPPAGKPLLNVLIDASASMATPDGGEGRTRYASAAEIATALTEQLRDRYEIQLSTFADAATPAGAADLATKQPSGEYTDIAAALRASLQTDRAQGQAVVLLSDGIHNAGSDAQVLEAARLADALSAPIYTQVLGGTTAVRDLAVEMRSPQELAFVGQRVPVRAIVQPRGLAGGRAQIALWDGDKLLEAREVTFASDTDVEVEFQVQQDRSGVFRYEVRAEPMPQEATLANNQSMYLLRVVDEPIRVLVLEGNPYWDTKFLMRTLATDQAIELTSIVQLTESRFLERTLERAGGDATGDTRNEAADTSEHTAGSGNGIEVDTGGAAEKTAPKAADNDSASGDGAPLPARARHEAWKIIPDAAARLAEAGTLSRYQIVVLGRDADVFLSDAAIVQLRRWLSHDGGSLVCFRGAPALQINERLRQLLPVRWNAARESRFRMQLTDSGKELRWIPTADDGRGDALAQLPSLSTVAAPADLQPQAVVWAVGASSSAEKPSPAAVALSYGLGRVVVIEGAGMWRWAFLAPQFRDQQPVYATLWHSLIRWLVGNAGLLPTQTLSLRSDKVRFSATEPATATLLVRESAIRDPLPVVELQGDALAAPQNFPLIASGEEPGAYRIAFGQLREGRYQARIAGSAATDPTAQTIFDVRSHVDELVNLTVNAGLMARIAEMSGGAVLAGTEPAEVATLVDKHLAANLPERVRKTSAWDRWWVIVGVFALWACTWGLRRRSGLI